MHQTIFGTYISQAEQLQGSWAGGATAAIYAAPADTLRSIGKAQVWAGTATIEHNADYSFFPERVRVHVPIGGNGLRLHFQEPEEVITLPTYAQYRFDGARPVHAELIDGPVKAFNLIAATDVRAKVAIIEQEEEFQAFERSLRASDGATLSLVYMVTGSLAIGETVMLAADDALIFTASKAELQKVSIHRVEADVAFVHLKIWQ